MTSNLFDYENGQLPNILTTEQHHLYLSARRGQRRIPTARRVPKTEPRRGGAWVRAPRLPLSQ